MLRRTGSEADVVRQELAEADPGKSSGRCRMRVLCYCSASVQCRGLRPSTTATALHLRTKVRAEDGPHAERMKRIRAAPAAAIKRPTRPGRRAPTLRTALHPCTKGDLPQPATLGTRDGWAWWWATVRCIVCIMRCMPKAGHCEAVPGLTRHCVLLLAADGSAANVAGSCDRSCRANARAGVWCGRAHRAGRSMKSCSAVLQ